MYMGKYAARGSKRGDSGRRRLIYMHRQILGDKEGYHIDHADGDRMDNRENNLRHCSRAQNHCNSKKYSNNKSGYKGVFFRKDMNKWCASIQYEKKRHYVGYFSCIIEAAKAYDSAALKMHRQFARVNFPGNK